MPPPQMGEEMLMAYVDGALDEETARTVEDAAARDEAIAAQIEAMRRTREEARAALTPLLNEPVPSALADKIREFAARHQQPPSDAGDEPVGDENKVVAFQPKPSPTAAPRVGFARSGFGMGIAASIALVVGLGAGFFAGGGAEQFGERVQTAQFNQPGLVDAIYSVASGGRERLADGTLFRPIATFPLSDDTLCREFELDRPDRSTTVSVACHSDGVWRTRFTVAAQANAEGYAPASSLDALQAYLSAVGADDPLEEAAELAALQRLR